jgi:hypothetical protein
MVEAKPIHPSPHQDNTSANDERDVLLNTVVHLAAGAGSGSGSVVFEHAAQTLGMPVLHALHLWQSHGPTPPL